MNGKKTHKKIIRRRMAQRRIVVVGGGNSAGYFARAVVGAQGGGGGGGGTSSSSTGSLKDLRVTMVCEEDVLPYERPALTKAFLNERAPARLPGFHTSVGGGGERQTEEWYREKGVETKVSTKVAKCDFAKKRVETVTGEIIEYDSLVIATGVSAHKASFIEGHDGKMCKVLRSHEDALEVVKAMDAKPKNPVVVGGGYIGLEVAAGMCARGLKPTVVLMESNVMSRLFTKEIAAHYEQLYESKGATFIKNASVKKINDGKSVILNDGRELNADLVILGVGSDVRPNVESFGDELEKAKDGGIKVNGKFETSQKDVYAIGDVCSFPVRLTGPNDAETHARMEHVKHARASAAHCARTVIGEKDVPNYKYEPFFYSRVFEQPDSDRPVSWQFYGFGGHAAMETGKVSVIGPIGDFKPQLVSFWIETATKKCIGCFLESGGSIETQIAKDCAEKNPLVDVDALSKSSTVAEAMNVLAEALKN